MKPNLHEVLSQRVVKTLHISFWSTVFLLTFSTLSKYPGQAHVYLLFSLVSNFLLYSGFRKNAIFFDTFLGIFLWLGFWLKLTVRVAFFDGVFHEPVGYFDGTSDAFDRSLLVTSCGLLGFVMASYFREKIFFNYPEKLEGPSQKGLSTFYLKYHKQIWAAFVILIVLVALTNIFLGIYQRGAITRTTLPFGLNGVYKWLLLFGLASISALIIRFEFERRKKTSVLVMALVFFESLVTNVSLLSRGMILNAGAIFYGVLAGLKPYSIKSNLRFFIVTGLIFTVLFIGSAFAVNYLRSTAYFDHSGNVFDRSKKANQKSLQFQLTQRMTTPLFIDRWVGMEGVMAVSSYPYLGWDLWKSALQETYNENKLSFYDSNLIQSAYAKLDTNKHHFISLPGIIAFFFYPGSFLFLFASMFTLGSMAAAIEAFVFRVGGRNIVLCALLAQVVAFRFASFGYVPKQSYLLFGTILLNVLIIYLADRLLTHFYSKNTPQSISIR